MATGASTRPAEETRALRPHVGPRLDVVTKEMYTFEDRAGGRLRLPEATAPIVRAYLENGLHREPQPQALHARDDLPLRPSAEGAVPRALAARRRGDRLRLRARRRGDPALRHAARAARCDRVPARAELDRGRRVPARLHRAPAAVAEEHAGELMTPRGAGVAQSAPRPGQHRGERLPCRRSLRRAPTIGDSLCDACRGHFDEVRLHLDAYGVSYEVCRPSCAASTTTPARPGSSSPKAARRAAERRRALRRPGRGLGGAHTPGVGFGADRAASPRPGGGRSRAGRRGGHRRLLHLRGGRRPHRCPRQDRRSCAAAGVRAETDYSGPLHQGPANAGREHSSASALSTSAWTPTSPR